MDTPCTAQPRGRLHRWLTRPALGLGGGAAAFLFLVMVYLLVFGSPRTRTYVVPDETVRLPTDAAARERGKHVVEAIAVCTICHGDHLGGTLAFSDAFLGQGYTSNLTAGRGGIAHHYTDADWVRAIRRGVDRHGRGLLFMPVDHYYHLSDEDLGAVIAYLKSLPPVDNERTALQLNLFARLLIDLGFFGNVVRAARLDHTAPRPPRPADDGAYLIAVAGCTFCHGDTLTGGQGPEPGAPPGPDLRRRGRLGRWSFRDFATTMRTGVTPDGHVILPMYMPWLGYRHMTDNELQAIWLSLQ